MTNNPMNPDTAFLMDLLLAVQVPGPVREALGPSYDLVCVPHARLAADRIFADVSREQNSNIRKRPMAWFDPRVSDWVCSLHDSPTCEFCGVSK